MVRQKWIHYAEILAFVKVFGLGLVADRLRDVRVRRFDPARE
jgi:hypothetical protein